MFGLVGLPRYPAKAYACLRNCNIYMCLIQEDFETHSHFQFMHSVFFSTMYSSSSRYMYIPFAPPRSPSAPALNVPTCLPTPPSPSLLRDGPLTGLGMFDGGLRCPGTRLHVATLLQGEHEAAIADHHALVQTLKESLARYFPFKNISLGEIWTVQEVTEHTSENGSLECFIFECSTSFRTSGEGRKVQCTKL